MFVAGTYVEYPELERASKLFIAQREKHNEKMSHLKSGDMLVFNSSGQARNFSPVWTKVKKDSLEAGFMMDGEAVFLMPKEIALVVWAPGWMNGAKTSYAVLIQVNERLLWMWANEEWTMLDDINAVQKVNLL